MKKCFILIAVLFLSFSKLYSFEASSSYVVLKKDTTEITKVFPTNLYKGKRDKFNGIPAILNVKNSIIKEFVLAKDTFYILYGNTDKENRLCIIDTDRDLDFSNNYQYHLKQGKEPSLSETSIQTVVLTGGGAGWMPQIHYIRPLWNTPMDSERSLRKNISDLNNIGIGVYLYSSGNFEFNHSNYKLFLESDLTKSVGQIFRYRVEKSEDSDEKQFAKLHYVNDTDTTFFGEDYLLPGFLSVRRDSLTLWKGSLRAQVLPEQNVTHGPGVFAGYVAPRFRSKDIHGLPVSSLDYDGKYLLIDFWGSWCPPCFESLPYLSKIKKKYPSLEIVSVAFELEEKSIHKLPGYIKTYEMEWTHLYELMQVKGEFLTFKFGVQEFPTSILIDPNGVILYRGSLVREQEEFERILSKLPA